MPDTNDPLQRVRARQHLEEINHYVLHDSGEVVESTGKLSLVWMDEPKGLERFLAVKPAGDEWILINGRRYQASEDGLEQGLRACLIEYRQAGRGYG